MKLNQDTIKSIIEKAKSLSGMIEFSDYNGMRFITTVEEFTELVTSDPKNTRKIATNLLRKALLKYADEYTNDSPNADYRRISSCFNFSSMVGAVRFNLPIRYKTSGISMKKRDGHKHIPMEMDKEEEQTVLDKLKRHWLATNTHSVKEKLFGFELEFASDFKFEEKIIKYREGSCGIEECCPGVGPVKERIEKIKLPPPNFREIQDTIPGVQMKHDGSVKPCVGKIAEATLLAGENGYLRLKKLCHEIRKRGGFVNHTCSVHVHLDARENDRRVAGIRASKLYDAMPILKELVPDSRINFCQCEERDGAHKGFNHYCRIIKPSFDTDRYVAINLGEAFKKYKTIEIRLGGASLNSTKIWHWAQLLLEISNSKTRYPSWEDFLKSEFTLYLRIWAVNRAHELRPNEKLRTERMNLISPGLDKILNSPTDEDGIE